MTETVLEPIFLDVELSVEEYELDVEMEEALAVDLETSIVIEQGGGERYQGPYDAIPSFDQQELLTRNKFLNDNVTVEPIPVSRTLNLSGGTTVYIGGQF